MYVVIDPIHDSEVFLHAIVLPIELVASLEQHLPILETVLSSRIPGTVMMNEPSKKLKMDRTAELTCSRLPQEESFFAKYNNDRWTQRTRFAKIL